MLGIGELSLVFFAPTIGSFLGVVVLRFPAGSVLRPHRSECGSCRHEIAWYDLLPIVSWIFLRGRCRRCHAPIGAFPLAIEVAALLIAVWAVLALPEPMSWFAAVLGWTLLAAAAIDFRHMVLPDWLVLPLVPLGCAAAFVTEPLALPAHVLGAALAAGSFYTVARLFRFWRGYDGLGQGDMMLAAVAGAWLGPQGLAFMIVLAALLGMATSVVLVTAGRAGWTSRIPFAPGLGGATWLVYLHGGGLA